MPVKYFVFQSVLFQLVWFACILQWGYWGLISGIALFVIHIMVSGQPKLALWLTLVISAVGIGVDSIQAALGLLIFEEMAGPLVPVWLMALWISFAAMFTGAMHWLTAYPKWAALGGAILGPWSYWSASWLGALEMHSLGLVTVGAFWAILMYIGSKEVRKRMPELSTRQQTPSSLELV